MQKVNFRYSDTDFVAYLLSLGYKYTKIETTKDRRDRLKVFFYFSEDKSLLLDLQEKYNSNLAKVEPVSLLTNRKRISKLIKSEILRYQATEL